MADPVPKEYPYISHELSSMSMRSEEDEGEVKEKSGLFAALLNLFKSIIGAGLLSFPYAFQKSGIILSLILSITVAIFQYHTVNLALNIRDPQNSLDFSSKSYYKAMGKSGRAFYKFFVLFLQFGICASYILVFTEFVENTIESFGYKISRFVYGLFACLIITPSSFITNMHSLYRYSIVGLIFTYVTLFTMLGLMIKTILFRESKKVPLEDFTHIGSSIGIIIFAFESVGTNFVVKDSMKNPSKFDFLYTIALTFYFVLYSLMGLFGSLTYGKNVDEVIIINMSKDYSIIRILQAFYGFNLLISYPIQMLPAMYYIEKIRSIKLYMQNYKFFRYIMRISINITLLFVTFSIPNFAHLTNLIGSFGGGVLQFIFPVFAYHNAYPKTDLRLKVFNYVCMVFGIICVIWGTVQSIIDIIKR